MTTINEMMFCADAMRRLQNQINKLEERLIKLERDNKSLPKIEPPNSNRDVLVFLENSLGANVWMNGYFIYGEWLIYKSPSAAASLEILDCKVLKWQELPKE